MRIKKEKEKEKRKEKFTLANTFHVFNYPQRHIGSREHFHMLN